MKATKKIETMTTTRNQSPMTTLSGLREFFSGDETKELANDAAGYQFVKRADGILLQYSNGKHRFYKTLDGFLKAVLWRIKRG